MLEHATVACPYCSNGISARMISVGRKVVYVVDKDCFNCGSAANKMESELNRSNKRSKFNVERSYPCELLLNFLLHHGALPM